MATLDQLKQALKQAAEEKSVSDKQPLSDAEYSEGFEIFLQGPGWSTYRDFIIPELSRLLTSLSEFRDHISVLEVGPGPRNVMAHLPESLRQKITKYTAFEPNRLFADKLEGWLHPLSDTEYPLPCLENLPDIHRTSFVVDNSIENSSRAEADPSDEKYDIVLFCHSMYGMKDKRKVIEKALGSLVNQAHGGVVVVFHRDAVLRFDGLVSNQTTSFPTGTVQVADDNNVLDCFASFVTGFKLPVVYSNDNVRSEWRKICRALGSHDEVQAGHLAFSAPNVMKLFTRHAISLPELTAQVPLVGIEKTIKNRKARLHQPASIIKPTDIRHIQNCVRWAIKHKTQLTVVGGGHSDHCLWPDVVAIDMSTFDQIHILDVTENTGNSATGSVPEGTSESLVVVGSGSTVGSIIQKTMAMGLTLPLGSRPSVGAGLWLQGGMGHLSRLHGLSCDAVVGAVVVSVKTGQILRVGYVPSGHYPMEAIRPENEAELLWAIRGAGTNFGIVVKVVFKAYASPTHVVRNWMIPLKDDFDAQQRLEEFDEHLASKVERNCSADVYLYWESDQLRMGVTMFESFTTSQGGVSAIPESMQTMWGPGTVSEAMNSVEIFNAEMYVSGMHGGHGGGKTSAFKRCVFLKNVGNQNVADRLVAAIQCRPSPLCYLHLLHGGAAVNDIEADATAFGCRDWHFACVITGVWPREKDDSRFARLIEQWVFNVANDLLPFSSGVCGADLGPDPRDKALVAKAYGPNLRRLTRLKHSLDPFNVLAYTSPIAKALAPKTVILVTGDIGAGKDYCANVWVSVINECAELKLTARVVSISDATKREYAVATGADFDRLLGDRDYKEQHRPALTKFFQDQVRNRPRLPEEHFASVVHGGADVDVLLITGLRDKAPIANLSHLVPECKLIEVRVQAEEDVRRARQGNSRSEDTIIESDAELLTYSPTFIFQNDTPGTEQAEAFAEKRFLPLFHDGIERLVSMVRKVPNFPCPGIDFRHVLGISQHPDGLSLCTSLLKSHFGEDWNSVGAIVSCEVGGIVFAAPLAFHVNVPLVPIRKAGRLPPPVTSGCKTPSHISSLQNPSLENERIEIERNALPKGAKVVVVDDVLATGRTLCAVIKLLIDAGVNIEDISILAVAEFPLHCGRRLLYRCNYGQVKIQSLLVFDSV